MGSCGNQTGTPSMSLMLLDTQALSRWESNLSGREFKFFFFQRLPIEHLSYARYCIRRCVLGWPEKAMAPHSSTLAWKIPWAEEPGRLQSMGSRRVGHEWVTSLSHFTFMHWRRKWQPTPVFLPEEFQGQGSLVGCRLWGRTESDTTEAT